eukprot:11000909-Prorocentrum_lima.AAC.1
MVKLVGDGSEVANVGMVAKDSKNGSTKGEQYIVARGCRCKVVRVYKYLGSVIHTSASMTPELTVRRRSALQAAHLLRSSPVMSRKVPAKLRLQLGNAVICSRLLW